MVGALYQGSNSAAKWSADRGVKGNRHWENDMGDRCASRSFAHCADLKLGHQDFLEEFDTGGGTIDVVNSFGWRSTFVSTLVKSALRTVYCGQPSSFCDTSQGKIENALLLHAFRTPPSPEQRVVF